MGTYAHGPKLGDEHLRALGYGLSGSHRVGKSSIARIIEANNKCPFLASSSTQIAKDMGLKVDAGMSLEDRMSFQERVLEVYTADYAQQNGLFVTDRTPIDLAGYALLDWHPSLSSPEMDLRIKAYVDDCLAVTSRYFFMVGVVQPGIPYVAEEGKPAPNVMYQDLLNTTIIGLAMDSAVKSYVAVVPRHVLDLATRVGVLTESYNRHLNVYCSAMQQNLPVQ